MCLPHRLACVVASSEDTSPGTSLYVAPWYMIGQLTWELKRNKYTIGFIIFFYTRVYIILVFPGGSVGKEWCRRRWSHPWVGRIPWRRAWQPIPVELPGESHGQRNLERHSPWGRKKSDPTQATGQAWTHVHYFNSYLFLSLSYNLLPKVKMSVEIAQWLTFSFCLDAQHSKRAARGSVCVCPSTNVQICACLPSPAPAVLPTSNTSLFLPWSYCWAIQLRV